MKKEAANLRLKAKAEAKAKDFLPKIEGEGEGGAWVFCWRIFSALDFNGIITIVFLKS